MLHLASSVSIASQTPYVSVDCFSTTNGPLVGELTFASGGPYFGGMYVFKSEWDEFLGSLWRQSSNELCKKLPMLSTGPIPLDRRGKVIPLKVPGSGR